MLVSAVVGLQVIGGHRASVRSIPDVLGVTVGHPDDVRVDRHEPIRGLLVASVAFGAYLEHDLVARSAFIARPAEDTARHLQQGRVVVERCAGAAAELVQGVVPTPMTWAVSGGIEPTREALASGALRTLRTSSAATAQREIKAIRAGQGLDKAT